MKITRLPDKCEPNVMLRKKMIERYRMCPCCGENRFLDFKAQLEAIKENKGKFGVRLMVYGNRRLGFQKPWYKHIFEGEKWWNSLSFKCETCGAEWESEEFPDIEY